MVFVLINHNKNSTYLINNFTNNNNNNNNNNEEFKWNLFKQSLVTKRMKTQRNVCTYDLY